MCEQRLGDSTGLRCTLDAEHTHGHVFVSSSVGDAHDVSEAASEATR